MQDSKPDPGATAPSLERVLTAYPELRRLAEGFMRRERPDHTLQPTALVHEVFLRLQRQGAAVDDRGAFLSAAARAMRFILVEHARKKRAQKRDGRLARQPFDEALVTHHERNLDLIALDEALQRLQEMDPQLARIVELRFFIGLETESIAGMLGVSTRTVERGWRSARTWLYHELNEAS